MLHFVRIFGLYLNDVCNRKSTNVNYAISMPSQWYLYPNEANQIRHLIFILVLSQKSEWKI